MKIAEVQIRNFMCFKDVNFEFRNIATILTGENGSGKTAFTKAIQFIMSSSYADYNKAVHLRRQRCPYTNTAFVKIIFLLTENNKETKKEETLVAIRLFSNIDNIMYKYKNLTKTLPVRNFQKLFKTDNDPFCQISITDEYFENNNLLHFIKSYAVNYLSKNFEEHIEFYHRHDNYDNKEPDEKSHRELLLAEQRVLEMLWISKHFDHNRQVNTHVLESKLNQSPDIENANNIFLVEHYLHINEIESDFSDARILKLESTMYDLIKELDMKNDEYKLLSSTYDFYCSPEKTYKDFLALYRNIYGITTTLLKSYVNFLMTQKASIHIEYMNKFQEETDRQERIREEISKITDERNILKKLYKQKVKRLRKIKEKLKQLRRKENRRNKKLTKTKDIIRTASRRILKELYDLEMQKKIQQVDADLSKIYEDHIKSLEIYLRNYFSEETIVLFKLIIELQKHFNEDANIIFYLKNTENHDSIQFEINLPYQKLPKLVFESLQDIAKVQAALESNFTEINPTIPCSPEEHENLLPYITDEQYEHFSSKDVLLCFLNEWIAVDIEGVEKYEELFANETSSEKVIEGGYRNTSRFLMCESYMQFKTDLRSIETQSISDDTSDYDFWSNIMDTKIRTLYNRYESNIENLRDIVQLLMNKLLASEELHEIFKQLHMLNLKLMVLKKCNSEEQLEGDESFAAQSILAQYYDEKLKLYLLKHNLITHSKFHISGNSILLSQDLEVYCNTLDSIAFEENINSYKEMIVKFENELISEYNKRYELTSEVLFIWPELNILKNKCSLNTEKDENIRRNLFPLDYDAENLHFNEYENLIYEKYEKCERKDFFGIHHKLKEIKNEIKCYEVKSSNRIKDSANKMPNQALNLRKLQMIVQAERALIDGIQLKTLETFKKLAYEINQIFQRLTKNQASVCFMIENNDDLMSLTDVELDFNWFSNVITLIETNNQKFLWTSFEGHLKQLLIIAARIALSAFSRIDILIVEDLNLLKDFQNVEFLKSSIRQKYCVPVGNMKTLSKNYIQNIVDICNIMELSAFLEYCGIISVQNCYVIHCKKSQHFSECLLIQERISLSTDFLPLIDESIKKRRMKRRLN